MYKKGNFLLLTLLLCTYIANAQKAITSGGVNIVSMSGNMSFVVGQVDYINTGNTATLSQGVLQVYNRLPITYVFNIDNTNTIHAWPNPVITNLFIKIDGKPFTDISYQVLDLNGQLIENNRIVSSNTIINMQKYPSGIYIVNVIYSNKKSVKFKIIKL
jgi:Secretion system C-terminal sorting domain